MPPNPLTNETWVLVADGEKALFLRNAGDAARPNLQVERKKKQGASRPGRFNDGPSVHRSAVGDTDWHQLARERFADDLAEMLYQRAHEGAFERIILVAAPDILGELRARMHKEVADRVVGEIPKTLTNHPVERIEKLLVADLG
jgi:protein required for attachment to host cells